MTNNYAGTMGADFDLADLVAQAAASPTDAGVAAQVSSGAQTAAALRTSYVTTEDNAVLNGRTQRMASDSFGTYVNSITPYIQRIATARGMAIDTSAAVGGSWFTDVARYAVGTQAPFPVSIGANNFVTIACGVNPARVQGQDATTLTAEQDALEMLLWLAASSARVADSGWTKTGTGWHAYSNDGLSGGTGFYDDGTAADYAEITPAAGDYIGIGYTYAAGIGGTAQTGTWTKNGTTTVATNRTSNTPAYAPPVTPNGTNIQHRPVRLLGLTGTDVIRVTATSTVGTGVMIIDDLIQLSSTPPWIVVVKPTYVKSGTYNVSDASIDAYRSAIDTTVNSVAAAYKPLRGKIIVVDPVVSGWDRTIHTQSDGLHPNDTGADFLARLVQRQVAQATRIRQQLLAAGLI